ncbi:Uncharacterised protein [Mycobacteroides abscessus subsp. abscessus]|nr:Uncharacterised protein [Mycobacteroides abscessus subsp. abscessus]
MQIERKSTVPTVLETKSPMGDHGVVAKAPMVMIAIIAAILPRVRRAMPTPRSNKPVRIR